MELRVSYYLIIGGLICHRVIDYQLSIRIDSCNSLPIEKILTSHVLILIKSVVNKIKNEH